MRPEGGPYRVVQWATGGVGKAAIEGVLGHPELELAGCWVHSESKDGVDVGELIGRGPIGVTASRDVDTVLRIDADCVIYSPLMSDPGVVGRILESGKNVVSPLGWFFPPKDEREHVDAIAKKAGVTIHGTVQYADRIQILVKWDDGSSSSLRVGQYRLRILGPSR